ncbi:MAG: hypothetical protein ACERKY_05415, partial [Anaerolineales bacterium]
CYKCFTRWSREVEREFDERVLMRAMTMGNQLAIEQGKRRIERAKRWDEIRKEFSQRSKNTDNK